MLSLLLWVVVVVVVASARCSFLSSVVAEEERTWTGEQCDTRRAKTRAYIYKKELVSFLVVLGKEIVKDDASTATTNVQPSRTRNDEENRFLLPRDGKDGERSSSERSR